MGPLLRSLRRVVVVTSIGLFLLWTAVFVAVRRPSLGSLDVGDLGAGNLGGADAERLRTHVELLAGLEHRDADHPEVLDVAARYVEQVFRAAGGAIELQDYPDRQAVFRNVVARFGPADGARIVVGAHYDALGLFGPNPGADDNASGTAGLLELARLFGASPPGVPVELVAFGTEEPPHFAAPTMGSAVHARSLVEDGVAVRFMVCLEMIGYFTDEQPWPNWLYRSLYPDTGDFVAIVGRGAESDVVGHFKRAFRGVGSLDAYGFVAPAWLPGTDGSDHRSYWQHGIPAVMVTDTAFVRNPRYHTPRDTPDSLDYGRMAAVVDGVFAALSHRGG